MFKTINDLDKEYDKGVQLFNDLYICPVCDKGYKTKKGAENHIEKRDCYDLKQLFQHTQTELMAYSIYKELITSTNPKATPDIRTFKKSPFYNGCIRFILFSNLNEVAAQKELYLTWLHEFKDLSNINGLMSEAIKESNLREFRVFLHQWPDYIDSASFYEKYKTSLIEDNQFLIRSLERAKIGVTWLLESDFPFERVMERMSPDYQIRFEDLMNKILTGDSK